MTRTDSLPERYTRWILPAQQITNHPSPLLLDREATLDSLADDEVLVELYAASLNYRDLMIAKRAAPGAVKPNVVPGSDGAGIVKAIGKSVRNLGEGDRVVTHLAPSVGQGEFPIMKDIGEGLGHGMDGTLQEFGKFPESGLMRAPKNLSFERAATLTCSGLTAWNALVGFEGREIRAGDWVLVEGTGGVSIAALQFAVALGAEVVATTSSDEKAKKLKDLGAKHIINYRETPDWGAKGRELTPDGRGFDFVVDVGGDSTLPESLKAVRRNGIVAATGLLGGMEVQAVPALAALWHVCIIRGILLGTRGQFADMIQSIEKHGIQPVVDDEVFDLENAGQAFQRLEAQKHFSKVVIRIKAEESR